MKTPTLLFLALTAFLSAQEKTKDPFIKEKKPAASPPAERITNVTFLVESFILPQADFTAWLDMPGGREKLHEKVLAAVKVSTAKLEACHFARGKSGNRFTLDSVDELAYPNEWSAADTKGFQYPVSFDTKLTGDRLEMEPTANSSGTALDLNQSFERTRFCGLRAAKADRTLPGIVVADFHEQRSLANISVWLRTPTLISAHSVEEGQMALNFVTPRVLPIMQPTQVPPLGAGNITLTPRVISLERMLAWELLQKHGEDGPALLAALKPMIADQKAVLEHLSTVKTKSGIRVRHEAVRQHSYATEFDPPTEGKPAQPADDPKKKDTPAKPPAQAGAAVIDCRLIGFNWEVEVVLNEKEHLIDTNIMFEHAAFAGNFADPLWNEHYPDYPVFSSQKITTSCTQAAGSTILLSTLNPPGDTGVNGRKDEGRVWLLFLEESFE